MTVKELLAEIDPQDADNFERTYGEQATMRASHYAACWMEGMTDDEIEADWAQVERDLNEQGAL